MPYIRRDFEDRPWFGALNNSLGSMIGLRQGEISDLRQQAGEQRSNAEFDRRTADARKYAEGQQAADRQRTGQGQGLMLDALRTAGIIKDTPEVGALRGGLEKDGLPGFQQMMEMYARKVQQEQEQKAKADEEARAAQEAGALQRTLGIGQQRPAIPLAVPNGSNPVMATIPGSPGETFQTPQAVEAAARIKNQREAQAAAESNRARDDQQRADQFSQRQAMEQQKLDLARQRLSQASQRRDLTPEQQNEVRAALGAMNDPRATPEDYAAAFMIARKYDYAPVGAAVQKREDPQDSAEARIMREKMDRAGKSLLAQLRKGGKDAKAAATKLETELAAMEAEYEKRFGAGAAGRGSSSPAKPTGDPFLDADLGP